MSESNSSEAETISIIEPSIQSETTLEALEEDDDGLTYTRWITLFLDHEILASKGKSTAANKARKIARENIASKINKDIPGSNMNQDKVRIAFNNKKRRLLQKTDSNRTGNVQFTLTDSEKKFFDFLNGPSGDNPAINSMPGGTSSMILQNLTTVGQAPSVVSTPSTSTGRTAPLISLKRPAPPVKPQPAKKVKHEITMELLEEQLQYFRNQNSLTPRLEYLADRMDAVENILHQLQREIDSVVNYIHSNIDSNFPSET